MSKNEVKSILLEVENAKREYRDKAANTIWENPTLFPYLVDIVFEVDNKESVRAAWILEWICTHRTIDVILPHLDTFTSNIKNVHFDSVKRPCAKICEHLAVAYTSKKDNLVKETLTQQHIEQIIETGFDWLIDEEKIAVKAYTMQTLYLFGLTTDWVHTELEHIIRTKVIHESKGCKARGKYILDLIEKHKKTAL